MSKAYSSIDPAPLGRVVSRAVYIQVAVGLLLVLAHMYAMTGAGQVFVDEDLRASDLPVGLTSILYLLAYFVCGFLALKWVYRVSRNAHAFASGLTVSPPWAVGWFFVPVASLWKPYEAMSEAWQATERPRGWRTAPKTRFLGWWWAAWLISNLLGSIANVVGRATDDIAANSGTVIVSVLASIVAQVLFIRLVNCLSGLQQTQIHFGVFDDSEEP